MTISTGPLTPRGATRRFATHGAREARAAHGGARVRSTIAEAGCLLACSREVVRLGLSSLLDREPGIAVTAHAADWAGALDQLDRVRADVVVLDPEAAGDWLAACAELDRRSGPAVVLYANALGHDDLMQATAAGCRNIVLWSSPLGVLVEAIRLACAGRPYVDAALLGEVIDLDGSGAASVSRREREVLQLLADGHTTERAAAAITLSPATVRSYVEHATRKLNARNRTHAVAVALRRGIII